MKTGLDFICGESPEILVLGSLPGDKSICAQQYYAHPQNHFWRIMSIILDEKMPISYNERLEILKKHKIALWDVLYSAERTGSLDNNIKRPQPNDLRALLTKHTTIKLIVLNGKKAQECYLKYFSDITLPYMCVRSSSPVASQSCNTAEEKAAVWAKALNEYLCN